MQLNVLLLPLVGGFLFLALFRRTAYFIAQQGVATLSFWLAAAGMTLLVIARLAVMLCKYASAGADALAVPLLDVLLLPLLAAMVFGLLVHYLTDHVKRRSNPTFRRPKRQLVFGAALLALAVWATFMMWPLTSTKGMNVGIAPLWTIWVFEFAMLFYGSFWWAQKIRVAPASMMLRVPLVGLLFVTVIASAAFYPEELKTWWQQFSQPTLHQIPSAELGTSLISALLGPFLAVAANLVYPRSAVELYLFRNRVNNSLERLFYRATRRGKMVMVTLDDNKVYCGYVDWIPGNPSSPDAYLEILPVFSGYRDSEHRRVSLPTSYTPFLKKLDKKDWGQFKKAVPVARITSAGAFEPHYFEEFGKNQPAPPAPASRPPASTATVDAKPESSAPQPTQGPAKSGAGAADPPPAPTQA